MTSLYNISTYSRFNLSDSQSDIQMFIKEYKDRITKQFVYENESAKSPFRCFADHNFDVRNVAWMEDNQDRFFKDTENTVSVKKNFLTECGAIFSMIYTPDGEHVICGHATGLIQVPKMEGEKKIIDEYAKSVSNYFKNENIPTLWYPMFYEGKLKTQKQFAWVEENNNKFLKGTPNKMKYYRWLSSEMGAITALAYHPRGMHIIVGHSSGMIQMRHGSTGAVLCTLRNIQFPPKPIYALEYSRFEERVCYAACMDGAIYRIEIPQITTPVEDPPAYCIRADPALECLTTQFYGAPGISSYSTPFITQRPAPLSLGITADNTKMPVGYNDASIKMYDMETQSVLLTYKVHKLRLQFIPKKLQRMHFGQVCALRCHPEKPNIFASGAWDKTLRIWDTRCKVGCIMTFEGVNICSDSIDFKRDHCLAGSWQTTEALTEWDLVAKKRLNVIRAQNRRPDVDGEYIFACRYWNSTVYNRKGKYGIIGGSGTKCLEVINLHNRYITCSYPAAGTILAVASYQERIAYGGTDTTFNIVNFYDPKHEKEKYEASIEPDFDYAHAVPEFPDSDNELQAPSYENIGYLSASKLKLSTAAVTSNVNNRTV